MNQICSFIHHQQPRRLPKLSVHFITKLGILFSLRIMPCSHVFNPFLALISGCKNPISETPQSLYSQPNKISEIYTTLYPIFHIHISNDSDQAISKPNFYDWLITSVQNTGVRRAARRDIDEEENKAVTLFFCFGLCSARRRSLWWSKPWGEQWKRLWPVLDFPSPFLAQKSWLKAAVRPPTDWFLLLPIKRSKSRRDFFSLPKARLMYT